MTLEIKIKLRGLKGKKIILSDTEKNILSGFLKMTISPRDVINEGEIKKYLSYLERERQRGDIKQEVLNAAYFLKEIGSHPFSFEITDLEVK